jgi:uncharacterized protein|tara:strand:- start:962 stop:1303 length:342 start_codon:yes stop_codon:yes gene_type:complete
MNAILNNQEIPLEIMDTPQSKSVGMMGRNNLEGGMLFPFDSIGERSFWMKNCNISLDILFIVNGKINNISKDCQPCVTQECNHYSGIADSVLELPGGYCEKNNVVVGDELSLY